MNSHFAYLQDLLRHKWLVILEGRELGLPLGQLIVHDLSKFLPDEWRAGVAFRRSGKADDAALRKHYRRNRHHPQYWLKNGDALPMPERFRLEMLADWRAVGRTKPGTTAAWYTVYGHTFPFHPETRAWVERNLRSSAPEPVKARLLRRR